MLWYRLGVHPLVGGSNPSDENVGALGPKAQRSDRIARFRGSRVSKCFLRFKFLPGVVKM